MRYLFIGNRSQVLRVMFEHDLEVEVGVIANSYLQREEILSKKNSKILENRQDVVSMICSSSADVLVSNGLPFILKKGEFLKGLNLNVHPSLLPDLRGPDPIRGAIIRGRDAGATCHVMDEGIDTGPIISQVRIPYDPSFHAGILYPLSFRAEAQAFRNALESGFSIKKSQADALKDSYGVREDRRISPLHDSDERIIRIAMAFRLDRVGALLDIDGETFQIQNAQISDNYFLQTQFSKNKVGSVVIAAGFVIVLKRSSKHFLIFESRSEVNSRIEGAFPTSIKG